MDISQHIEINPKIMMGKPALKAEIVVNMLAKYKDELIKSFTVIQPNAIRIRKWFYSETWLQKLIFFQVTNAHCEIASLQIQQLQPLKDCRS